MVGEHPTPTGSIVPEHPTPAAGIVGEQRALAGATIPGAVPAREGTRAFDGAEIYEDRCATCHQLDGTGVPDVFPPLTGSDWVTGDKGRLIRIVLQGMSGEVQVKGSVYTGVMPGWSNVLDDQEVAEVTTFIRSTWTNRASEVSTNEVARVRAATRDRQLPWTARELLRRANSGIPDADGDVPLPDEEAGPPHPFPVQLPFVYRTFMPESSPASVAVGMPGDESYCFDAGGSYLRYAWHGGFVDNTEHWDGNGNAFSDIKGSVYYRNEQGFPFRIGDPEHVPEVAFGGYRLVDGGYPEFRYTIDGIEVRELIKPHEGGGLVREFDLGALDETLWFVAGSGRDTLTMDASAGTWEGPLLRLSPRQANRFTITMLRATGPK